MIERLYETDSKIRSIKRSLDDEANGVKSEKPEKETPAVDPDSIPMIPIGDIIPDV